MEYYKEFKIKYFSNIGSIIILMLIPFLIYYVVYLFNGQIFQSIVVALIVSVIIISTFLTCILAPKRVIMSCKSDKLSIQFNGHKVKEYNINLLSVSEYKEVFIFRGGKLVFINNDTTFVEIPYTYIYEDIRKELLSIIENYEFKKTLVF